MPGILITGCSQGLGHALSIVFSEKGFEVYAVGRNQKLLTDLGRLSSNIHPIVADIATEAGRDFIAKEVCIQGPFFIIHNAAIAVPCTFEPLSEELLRAHFETNFFAPFLITQMLLPKLLPGTKILHISSGAANLALPGLMPYCLSKGALDHLTACLNAELQARQIYCANLYPGLVDTPMEETFRQSSIDSLPGKEFYVQAHRENKLAPPDQVAAFIVSIMLEINGPDFAATPWTFS